MNNKQQKTTSKTCRMSSVGGVTFHHPKAFWFGAAATAIGVILHNLARREAPNELSSNLGDGVIPWSFQARHPGHDLA